MIHGIGTDIVKLERFEQLYQRHETRFADHLLMPDEMALYVNNKRPARFLAMHWAAKEAVVKALGTGFAQGMWLRDVGYRPDALGKPEVIWSLQGQAVCARLGVGEAHLTLSDDHGLIVAVAVIMRASD